MDEVRICKHCGKRVDLVEGPQKFWVHEPHRSAWCEVENYDAEPAPLGVLVVRKEYRGVIKGDDLEEDLVWKCADCGAFTTGARPLCSGCGGSTTSDKVGDAFRVTYGVLVVWGDRESSR